MTVVGWRTTLMQIDSCVFAETRSKARYATLRAARSAGYDVPFTAHVRVVRAPELDGITFAASVLSEDYCSTALRGGRA